MNGFINDLGDEAECTLSTLTNDTKLGGVADTSECCATIQRDVNRLEKQAQRNTTKFIKEKSKVLQLERNNPRHQEMLRAAQWESSLAEKDLVVLVDTKLTLGNNVLLPQRRLK